MADFEGYITLILAWIVSMVCIRLIVGKTRKKGGLPPSPRALPIIGHLHTLAPIPHQALHKLSIKYGPLIHIRLGSVPVVVASTPEMAKEFLKTHENSYSDRPRMTAVDFLTYGSADFSFAPYGPYWKFMKNLCMTEVLGSRTLSQLLPVRQQEISRFLQFMLKKAEAGESVDVGGQLITLTNNVISRMTMSKRCSDNEDEADEVRKIVRETAELTGTFNLSDYIWFCKNMDLQGLGKRLKEVRGRFDTLMERIIKEHEEARELNKKTGNSNPILRDLLNVLLEVAEDESSEIKLTRENIKAFVLDLFVAGTDTSAITTGWALAELINNPHIMEKAREEIDSVVGKTRIVEESDIDNLPYLQAVVKETLRLHPTGPMIVRQSTDNCTVGEYEIPAGTQLFVNVWAIGRDPNHWDNPLEFRPERFLNPDGHGSNQLDVKGQHFHLLPFGSGRRRCPGISLALQMVQPTLAAMIQCFEWKVSGENGCLDMEEGPGITLPMAHPLSCLPVARLDPFPSPSLT